MDELLLNLADTNRTPYKPPLVKKLPCDRNLTLSQPKFLEIIQTRISNNITVLTTKEKLNFLARPPFPDVSTLVKFASRVYGEGDKDKPLSNAELPTNWELLTTAQNCNPNNHYFGAAYWNPNQQLIVIAHRGTVKDDIASLWTDVGGVLRNRYVPQVYSAVTFAYIIRSAINMLNEMPNTYFRLSFTGHSLGGWLSQITTFTTEYLNLLNDLTYFVKDERIDFHGHTVAFDSPGGREFLEKLESNFHNSGKNLNPLCDTLDITSYLSAPNLVNTCHRHVGVQYRIFIDYKPTGSLFELEKYTLAMHSIENIKKCVSVKDFRKVRVVDWPLVSIRIRERFFERLMGFLNVSGVGNELDYFITLANEETNFSPDEPENRRCCGIRYQVEEVDDTKIDGNVFSNNQLQFLMLYREVGKKVNYSGRRWFFYHIIKEDIHHEIMDFFDSLKLKDDQTLCCKSQAKLLHVISYVNNALHFYPDLLTNVINAKNSVKFGVRDRATVYIERPIMSEMAGQSLKQGKLVVVHGLDGVGKTEFAVNYAHKHSDQYFGNIIWINAESKKTVEGSLMRLLEVIDKLKYNGVKDIEIIKANTELRSIDDMLKAVYEWFHGRPVLLICDNVEDDELIQLLLPPANSSCHVLITTQDVHLIGLSESLVQLIEIDVLAEDNAIKLIKDASGIKPDDSTQDEDLKKLAFALGYLPLALQLVPALIRDDSGGQTVREYKHLLESPDKSYLLRGKVSAFDKNLYVLITAAINKIEMHENGKLAVEILQIISYLNSDCIDGTIFLAEEFINSDLEERKQVLRKAINLLIKSSLITVTDGKGCCAILSTHRLLQREIRMSLREKKTEEEILHKTLSMLATIWFSRSPDLDTIWKYAKEYDTLINKFIVGKVEYFYNLIDSLSHFMLEAIFVKLTIENRLKLINYWCPTRSTSAMHLAALSGIKRLVELFVKAGGDVNLSSPTTGKNGETPIFDAVRSKSFEVFKYLANNGATLFFGKSVHKTTLIHLAAELGNLEVAKYLIENGCHVNLIDKEYNEAPITVAARYEKWDIMYVLLENGSDVNLAGPMGTTPLIHSAIHGNVHAMERLLAKGADIEAADVDGMQAVHFAADMDNLEILQTLVNHKPKANVNAVSAIARRPIHFARSLKVSEFLNEHGAVIGVTDSRGISPLHIATARDEVDVMKFLVSHAVDINVQDKDGCAPVHIAVGNRCWAAFEFLLDKGAKLHLESKIWETNNYWNVGARLHLQVKDKVTCAGGLTPMHIAALNNDSFVMEALVHVNATIIPVNGHGPDDIDEIITYYAKAHRERCNFQHLPYNERTENTYEVSLHESITSSTFENQWTT